MLPRYSQIKIWLQSFLCFIFVHFFHFTLIFYTFFSGIALFLYNSFRRFLSVSMVVSSFRWSISISAVCVLCGFIFSEISYNFYCVIIVFFSVVLLFDFSRGMVNWIYSFRFESARVCVWVVFIHLSEMKPEKKVWMKRDLTQCVEKNVECGACVRVRER